MFMSRSSRGCGKCGKAEAFFAEAFPSSLWKSSIKSRRRRPLSISTAAAFSTAPRARRFRRADEETDIRNGKNSSKVRNRIQTSTDRRDRRRPDHHRAGRARSSDIPKRHRTMARSLPQQRPGRSSIQPGTPTGSRERKAPSQGVGELVMQMDHLKKLQAWVQRRKNVDTSIITAKNWDQFRKPAK